MSPRKDDRASGFTLIELITVISIIAILAAVALPQYRLAIIHAKEAVLREDLFRLRSAIDQYQADKGKCPEKLDALVGDYLRAIPIDPMTGQRNWVEVTESDNGDPAAAAQPGVCDVHSAASDSGYSDRSSYEQW
jgi:general secretion pathway protein G